MLGNVPADLRALIEAGLVQMPATLLGLTAAARALVLVLFSSIALLAH